MRLPYALGASLTEWVPLPAGIPVGFWRSVGSSINAFAVESMVDELAMAAGAVWGGIWLLVWFVLPLFGFHPIVLPEPVLLLAVAGGLLTGLAGQWQAFGLDRLR